MAIEWKQIELAPDYWISNRGEVISKRTSNEKTMKLHLNGETGYLQITLVISDKGAPRKIKTFYPHKEVAKYFVENPKGYNFVHHLNHNKTDNHAVNLRWVSQEQNIHEYYLSNEADKPREMKAIEVWKIDGTYMGMYPSINRAAKELKTSPSNLWFIASGRTKNSRTWIVKYVE